MNICVIPARGGSKRIPRKNIRIFHGKPIIEYAISCALESDLFEHVVVSTDDQDIANVARECGAEIPFMRADSLADDHTPTVPVVADAIIKCEAHGWSIENVCCIYPCVPFLRPKDLHDALRLLNEKNVDYLFPIVEFPSPIHRAMRLEADGRVSKFFLSDELDRTQDLERAFHDAGQFYWGRRRTWLCNPLIHSNGAGLVLAKTRAMDIDSEDDWILAELLYHSIHSPHWKDSQC